MKGQLAVQEHKKGTVLPASTFSQHTVVISMADHTVQPEPVSALNESHVGQDFSRVPVHTYGPDAGHAKIPCPLTPRRCPFGGAGHTCPVRVQRNRAPERGHEPEEGIPPIVYDVLRSPGQPLDRETRQLMEPRFGHDFSQVRVHTNAKAAESARAVNALAYTVGNDIVFGEGLYAPTAPVGRQLLWHELTHVIQQQGASLYGQSPLMLDSPRSSYEQEAQAVETVSGAGISASLSRLVCRSVKSGTPQAGLCGGPRTCASGAACAVADNAIVGPMPPSLWWKLTVMIDVEAPTAAAVTESTPGHAYVKFTESNGNVFTYGFYPDPARPPNVFRTRTTGCVVHPDTIHESCVDYREDLALTQPAYDKALSSAQLFCRAAPTYDLQTFNCTTFADTIVRLAGKSLPSIRGTVGSGMFSLPADNPNTLLEGLKARDAARAGAAAP
jgi:hypothetical protein